MNILRLLGRQSRTKGTCWNIQCAAGIRQLKQQEAEVAKSLLARVAKYILMTLVDFLLQVLASPKKNRGDLNHHSNQKNPNNPAHAAARNNRANQLNPNNSAYHKSRANSQR